MASPTPIPENERLAAGFRLFHEVASTRLGVREHHNALTLVATAVGVHRSVYLDALEGRVGDLDLLSRWAATLGLEVSAPATRPIVVRPPETGSGERGSG